MPSDIAKRVVALRKKLNMSQVRFGQEIGVSQPSVSRWEAGEDIPEDAHIAKMASLAGTTMAEFRYGESVVSELTTVPVVGYIGAGEQLMPVDDHPVGQGFERASLPPDVAAEGLVALRIKGDSMRPLKDGWIVYYQRDREGVPDECLGELCVVKVVDGPTYIKEVRRGSEPGQYHLLSWTAGTEVIEDQPVEWAALVVAVKRP